MAMTRHSHNDADKPTLLIALFLSLCVITNLEAQVKTVRPDDMACPVTENLFPEQIQSPGTIKYIFTKDAIPWRISIALIYPEHKDMHAKYSWIGSNQTSPFFTDWGVHSGVFVTKGNGKPNCFFFADTDIPVNVPCKEFILRIPEGVLIEEVAFSSLSSERPVVTCPMPELENKIARAYLDCELDPKDKKKAMALIQLLERITPSYDCRRPHADDSRPVPAWWMASRGASDRWIEYLYHKVLEYNADALRAYQNFLATSDGYTAEYMTEQMWGILHAQPLFILENWTGIKDNKEWLLMSRPWPGSGGISEMIEIYRDIAIKETKYKSACDEIISILSEKNQAESSKRDQAKSVTPV